LDAALPEYSTEILDAPGINATEILNALEHTPTRILDASRQNATKILDALKHILTRILDDAFRQNATKILDARSRITQAQTNPARSQILNAANQITPRAKSQSGNA
jgi:vacuolar-type H+-ATPase subunit E/Vma4